MTRLTWLSCAAALLVASCGGSHGRECTFNSDCPTGRYCTAAGACTADCTTASECVTMLGAGAACSSFGMCVAAPDAGALPDAGGRDAGTPMDAGARDAGPGDAGTDAGPAMEICTPSTPGSVAVDEDGDGAFDEGCTWHFGRPHPLVRQHASSGPHYAPQLSADGQRLYFVSYTGALGNQVFVAERTSRSAQFGAPTRVAGTDFARFAFGGVTLSGDELELFAQATETVGVAQDIYRTTRPARAMPFGAMTRVVGTATANDVHPFITRDDRELYYVTNETVPGYGMKRVVRASSADPFGAAEDVTFPMAIDSFQFPSLTRDGRTLFFQSHRRLFRAERADTASAMFSMPEEVAELTAGLSDFVFFSDDGREAIFNSPRDWSPSSIAMWRVQVCRDGPCDEPLVACTAGTRSPDGFHCYFSGPTTMETWGGAVVACATRGAHLATVHSEAERALLWSSFGGGLVELWLGASDASSEGMWRWDWPARVVAEDPEEPFIFQPWGTGEPNGGAAENCVTLLGRTAPTPGLFNDTACSGSHPYACEDDTWPTW